MRVLIPGMSYNANLSSPLAEIFCNAKGFILFDTEEKNFFSYDNVIYDTSTNIILGKYLKERCMGLIHTKNTVVEKLFSAINKAENLNFEERIVLKSLTAYGCHNVKYIASLLNTHENDIQSTIRSLRQKKWILDSNIIKVES